MDISVTNTKQLESAGQILSQEQSLAEDCQHLPPKLAFL